MAQVSPQESLDALERRLAGGDFPPAFLFHGPQDYFRSEGLRIVFARAGDKDRVQLDGATPPEEQKKLAGDLRTPSLFGKGKVLVVREDLSLGGGRDKAGLDKAVLSFLERPTPGVHLVLLRREKLQARSKLLKAFQKARGVVVLCRELYANPFPGRRPWETELHRWISGRAARLGLRLAPESLLLLAGVLGNSPGEAAGFLERLRTHLGEGWKEPVPPGVVQDLLGPGGEANQFELAGALLKGKVREALLLARGIARSGLKGQDGRPMDLAASVIVTLSWAHQALARCLRAHHLLRKGMGESGVESALNIHYFRERFWEEVRASTPERLEKGLRALLRADRRLKVESEDPGRVLEAWVAEALEP